MQGRQWRAVVTDLLAPILILADVMRIGADVGTSIDPVDEKKP